MNSEGIIRENLMHALKDPRTVREAKRIDRCLLCRRPGVNDAALCEFCWALLDEDELKQGQRWLSGVGP